MFMRAFLAVALVLVSFQPLSADVYVQGYFRSNGTYVAPHYRSDPDGDFGNNWTTYGNVNPYTGKVGTRVSPSYSSPYTPSYYPQTTVPSYQSPTYFQWGW